VAKKEGYGESPLIILRGVVEMLRRGPLALLLGLSLLCGCAGEDTSDRLIFYCGAGMRRPVQEIVDRVQRETGAQVEMIYAGSAVLLAQIELKRTGDLYMPGDDSYIETAQEKGLVHGEPLRVASFVPVIGVRKGSPHKIEGLGDLATPGLKVGFGDPRACAVGRVTDEILEHAGLKDLVEGHVVMRSSTVVELGNALKLGTIAAAIIWDVTARLHPEEVEIVPIERDYNVIAPIEIGVLSFSEHPELSMKLARYLASSQGKEVFDRHG
jgi:molybdate transport system substrate-binding protein